MSTKMTTCKTCGKEIAISAKACPECGAKNKKPIYKKPWFWALLVIAVIIGAAGSNGGETSSVNTETPSAETSVSSTAQPEEKKTQTTNAFAGECGISATGEMSSSIIGLPQLTISITNTTDKEIAAVKFYVVPCDVYGDEIKGWTAQNHLYTDTAIAAGKSTSINYQFIEDSVKKVKLYVYSVYFSDGTEWGNRDATKSVILKNGAAIEVFGNS